jgi:hypothetical protein
MVARHDPELGEASLVFSYLSRASARLFFDNDSGMTKPVKTMKKI